MSKRIDLAALEIATYKHHRMAQDDQLTLIAVARAAIAVIRNRDAWDAAMQFRDPDVLETLDDEWPVLIDDLRAALVGITEDSE